MFGTCAACVERGGVGDEEDAGAGIASRVARRGARALKVGRGGPARSARSRGEYSRLIDRLHRDTAPALRHRKHIDDRHRVVVHERPEHQAHHLHRDTEPT